MRETTKISINQKFPSEIDLNNKSSISIDNWLQVKKIIKNISSYPVDDAIIFFKNAIKKFPKKNQLIYEFALFYYENNQNIKALEIIKKIDFIKNDYDIVFLKGLIFAKLGNYKKSKKFLEIATKINPKNPQCYNYLGLTLTDLYQLNDAIKNFNHALELEENNEFYDNKARAFYRLGKFDEALKNIDRSLDFDSSNMYSIIRKGFILQELEQFKEAEKCFKKILKLKSPLVSFIAIQCRALIELKMPKECIVKADEFLKFSNYKEAVLTDKARSLFLLKKNKVAEEYFCKAIKSNTYPWANYYYASFKVSKKDYVGAIKQLVFASKKIPWILEKVDRDPNFKNLLNNSDFCKLVKKY